MHWTYDTWSVANSTARAVVQQGGKKWFFLTSDYAFGHALEKDGSRAIKAAGGEVLGSVIHPYNTPDMSAYVLQVMAGKPQVTRAGELVDRRDQFRSSKPAISARRR